MLRCTGGSTTSNNEAVAGKWIYTASTEGLCGSQSLLWGWTWSSCILVDFNKPYLSAPWAKLLHEHARPVFAIPTENNSTIKTFHFLQPCSISFKGASSLKDLYWHWQEVRWLTADKSAARCLQRCLCAISHSHGESRSLRLRETHLQTLRQTLKWADN